MENLLDVENDGKLAGYGLLSAMFNNMINPGSSNPMEVIAGIRKMRNDREDRQLNREYKTLQEQVLKAQLEEQRRTSAFRDNLMQNIGPLMASGQPQQVPMQLPELNHKQGDSNNRLYVETPQQRAHLQKQLEWLEQNDPETHKQVLSALVKQGAISQPMQTIPGNPQAWQQLAQFGALGELGGVKGASGLVELAKLQKPEYMNIDTGNGIQMVDKNNPGQTFFKKGYSPDKELEINWQREKEMLPIWDSNSRSFVSRPSVPGALPTSARPEGMAPKDPTEGQAKARGFVERMIAAEKVLSDPATAQKPSALTTAVGNIPVLGGVLGNAAADANEQKQMQGAEDWIRAFLRKESGAAIGKDEFNGTYKTFFPQIGDSQEVIAQKEIARRNAISGIIKEGGEDYQSPQMPKQRSKSIKLDDGSSVIGILGADGSYYVKRNGKTYKVED